MGTPYHVHVVVKNKDSEGVYTATTLKDSEGVYTATMLVVLRYTDA